MLVCTLQLICLVRLGLILRLILSEGEPLLPFLAATAAATIAATAATITTAAATAAATTATAAAAAAAAKASSWAGRTAPAEARDASGPTTVPPPLKRKPASASASASSASAAAAVAQKPASSRTYAQLLCDHEPLPSELVKLTLRREGGPEQRWGVRLTGDER